MELTPEQQAIWTQFKEQSGLSEEEAIAYFFELIQAANTLTDVLNSHSQNVVDPTWLMGGMG